ncbi:MAG TPA: hypothetical protein VHU18_03435 [Rhizomicrobium sp.]|nr:hypothetical protein [Rhizomicrobium sp.]
MIVGRVLAAIEGWAGAAVSLMDRAYVFGSLVNNDGAGFIVQGSESSPPSDIDLICFFTESAATTASGRHQACKHLRRLMPKLELALLLAIGRYDSGRPIVSVNFITPWEAEKCIHKDGVRRLFYLKQFRPILPPATGFQQLATFIDNDFHGLNEGPVRLFQYVQSVRNRYLRTNVHNEDFARPQTGSDPVPKQLMRLAAACAAFERDPSGRPDDLDSIDPAEGLDFLTVMLNEARSVSDPEIDSLRRWLSVARNARGTDTDMTADQSLLLSELLVDRAKSKLVRSPVDKVGAAIKRSQPTP